MPRHAREMGHDPDREPPFFFLKPADAALDDRSDVPYPPQTSALHHEVELVVAIGIGGADIDPNRALDHVYGYAVGLDLTRRDLQNTAKKLGRPWDWAKGFDNSAPIAAIRPVASVGHPNAGRIWLAIDDEIRQDADLSNMIWSVSDIIAIASQSMQLSAGDLIMTGTPSGVGPVERGQLVTGGVEGVGEIRILVR